MWTGECCDAVPECLALSVAEKMGLVTQFVYDYKLLNKDKKVLPHSCWSPE